MGRSLFDKIQAKLELWRLEQRYTRHRNRRSTFQSNAVYVDGEYVFQSPSSTGNSSPSSDKSSSSVRVNALHGDRPAIISSPSSPTSPISQHDNTGAFFAPSDRKRLNRYSSMPGFGASYANKELPMIQERRTSMIR